MTTGRRVRADIRQRKLTPEKQIFAITVATPKGTIEVISQYPTVDMCQVLWLHGLRREDDMVEVFDEKGRPRANYSVCPSALVGKKMTYLGGAATAWRCIPRTPADSFVFTVDGVKQTCPAIVREKVGDNEYRIRIVPAAETAALREKRFGKRGKG